MFRRLRLLFLPLLLSVAACDQGLPSVHAGEALLRSRVDDGSEDHLRLENFRKTDGQQGEMLGVELYAMDFEARMEVVANCIYDLKRSLSGAVTAINSLPLPTTPRRPGEPSRRIACKGDQFLLTGQIIFEAKESGWNPTDVYMEVVHDSTSRNQDCGIPESPAPSARPGSSSAAIPGTRPPQTSAFGNTQGTVLERMPGEYLGRYSYGTELCADVSLVGGTTWHDLEVSMLLYRCDAVADAATFRVRQWGEGVLGFAEDPDKHVFWAEYKVHQPHVENPGWALLAESDLFDEQNRLLLSDGEYKRLERRR